MPLQRKEFFMYLHLGRDVIVPQNSIVGVFDLDNTTYCRPAAKYLNTAQQEGRLVNICDDIPRSAVLCQNGEGETTLYISQLATATLFKRLKENKLEFF